jgi:plastocyanin
MAVSIVLAACGSSPSTPSPPPVNPNQVVIGANGAVSPVEIVVSPGSRVLFVNQHNRAHDMASDQHPDHRDCPEINDVGFLQPGQSRETGNLVTVRTCGYHDHGEPDNNALKGRIVIR